MPTRGLQYPGSYAELRAWFPDDEAGMDYLDWLRWPGGPVCPACGRTVTTVARGRIWRCGGCRKRVSRTAGTIFQDSRTSLTVWFAAAWYMSADLTQPRSPRRGSSKTRSWRGLRPSM